MPSAKVLNEKKQAVAQMVEKLQKAQAGVFVDYIGLTVSEDTDLRNKLRAAGVEYKVVKNTLTRFAAKEVGYDELDPILNGPTSLAISYDDPIAPAKVIAEFAKSNDKIEIKSGFLDGKVISLDEIKTLASTPSKDVLLAKLMGSLNSPVSSLARVLQAIVDKGVEFADMDAPAAVEAPVEAAEEVAEETAPVAEEVVEEAAEAPAEETATEE